MQLKSLEQVLADARVLEGDYDDYDAAKARQRLAKDVSRLRWESLFDLRLPHVLAQRRCGDSPLPRPQEAADRRPAPAHAQAATELQALSIVVIHDHEAPSFVARLVNDRRIEPDGALVLACLLDLAKQEEGAQFWWQFAAGAGNATSAYCLYLLHLRRGETRDAAHWAEQIRRLNAECDQYLLQPSESTVRDVTPHRDCPCRDGVLRDAVEHLPTSCDDDYGLVPQPDPALAGQLEALAAAC
ncbi:hypothetical protein JK359_33245 [Streptomyces actinomycinicus]|uniref:Uncharacterized protein n=1 Tax=Streptomyces actinomycinicus TaxID=1695166 RepID=A0A937ERR9_9ACTN|nr:hypothetical protein [Streptomyces actinomycinicus]MBL1086774.1 hypothetical protein [Streptomyces actinomycinicus]